MSSSRPRAAEPVTGRRLPGDLERTTPDEFNALSRDATTRLFERFPNDTAVYPDGGKDTTLGTARPVPRLVADRW